MERPVGNIFVFTDVRLIVTEGKACKGCYFLNKEKRRCDVYYKAAHPIAGYCSKFFRGDKTNVIFAFYNKVEHHEN